MVFEGRLLICQRCLKIEVDHNKTTEEPFGAVNLTNYHLPNEWLDLEEGSHILCPDCAKKYKKMMIQFESGDYVEPILIPADEQTQNDAALKAIFGCNPIRKLPECLEKGNT